MDKNPKELKIKTRDERIRFIKELIGGGRRSDEVRKDLNRMGPEDIAEVLSEFSSEDKLRIFNFLEKEAAAVVLDDTDSQTRLQILQKLENDRLAEILDHMPVDEAADIVEEMPEKDRDNILDLMEEEDAEELEEILSYPEDSAGRVMDPDLVFVSSRDNIESAIQHIRSLGIDKNFSYVYVVDENKKLCGVVPIHKLLLASKDTMIKDMMEKDVHSVAVEEDQEKAAHIMKKYDLFSLPVIDENGTLEGRITVDDIIDVMDEEHAEDISRMTGTIEDEEGTETTLRATQNRLPWLITCMLGSIITGLVIQMFEVTLTETIALVSFIPVITATGGNSGVQASTVVVREIALGTVRFSKVGEEIWRQTKIALGLGFVCGTVLTLLANMWMKNNLVGLIVGLSIFLVVVWSNIVGVVTPLLFKTLKIDPAIASGPLITTLNDVIGVLIYLSIATVMLT